MQWKVHGERNTLVIVLQGIGNSIIRCLKKHFCRTDLNRLTAEMFLCTGRKQSDKLKGERRLTKRLFDTDAYRRTFTARVVSCEEYQGEAKRSAKQMYAVCLTETAFYPEGGGQKGDTGLLYPAGEPGEDGFSLPNDDFASKEGIEVLDTREKGGEIFHICSRPLKAGTFCRGEIDWEQRFDLMQNHTGEHIVSGLIHQTYGYDNVGFHMGEDILTIDLSGELTKEQLAGIEYRANEAVWKDLPVKTLLLEDHDSLLKTLPYRSKKELKGIVRLVEIPDTDLCACCGTHVSSTGQIGLIRLLGAEKFRGGVRVQMLCGKRALIYDRAVWEQNHGISVLLSAKELKTRDAAARLKESEERLRYRLAAMEQESFEAKATVLSSKGDCLLLENNMEPDSVRKLAVAVMEKTGGLAAVFARDPEQGFLYTLGQTGGDLRELVREMNGRLSGRGGGKPFFAQGRVAAGEEEIVAFFKEQRPDIWIENRR